MTLAGRFYEIGTRKSQSTGKSVTSDWFVSLFGLVWSQIRGMTSVVGQK